jgi:hypothetical protein
MTPTKRHFTVSGHSRIIAANKFNLHFKKEKGQHFSLEGFLWCLM